MKTSWEKINIGDKELFEVEITQEMVSKFVEVTGDDNALHTDESFAQAKGFNNKVVHGMLLGSLFSKLVGKHFLGDDNLYLSQNASFRKPVFIGDRVIVSGIIKEKIESAKILRIETTITGSSGVAVTGEAQVQLNNK